MIQAQWPKESIMDGRQMNIRKREIDYKKMSKSFFYDTMKKIVFN